MSRVDSLKSLHGELSERLAFALRELGDLNAEVIRVRSSTWRATDHLAVTERRETCRESTAIVDVEVVKLIGDIDAYRVELNNIELQLRYNGHADPV